MFFSSPSLDLQISLTLLGISLVISIFIYIFKRKLKVTFICLSILANLSFLVNLGSRMYSFYRVEWFVYFVFIFWPLINFFLIIVYVYKFKKK